jgi:WD40 repeat protein
MRPRGRVQPLASAWTCQAGEYVTGLAARSPGDLIIAGTAAGEVLLLDAATGAVASRFEAHAGGLLTLDLHPTEPVLATGGRDGHVRLWDLTGAPRATFKTGVAWVERLAWSPSGHTLAVAAGREVLLLDSTGRLGARTGARPSTVSGLGWSRAPEQLWSSELRGARRWDPATGAELGQLSCPGSLVGIAVVPDASALACAGQDTTVRYFRAADGVGLTFQSARSKPTALGWSPSGRFLAHGGAAPVVLWDFGPAPHGAGDAAPVARLLETHQAQVTTLAFALRDERLASGAADGSLAIWDLEAGGRREGFTFLASAPSQLAWSPEGDRLFAATADGTVASLLLAPRRSSG